MFIFLKMFTLIQTNHLQTNHLQANHLPINHQIQTNHQTVLFLKKSIHPVWLVMIVVWLGISSFPALAEPTVMPNICNSGYPAYLNSDRQGKVILLGRPSDHRYVVAIPDFRKEILLKTRQCVADAFITEADPGQYIQAGTFSRRSQAEFLTFLLRQHGLDARVMYF